MLRPLSTLAIVALLFTACSDEPKPNVPAEPPPAQPSPAATPEKPGTSIELGEGGVKVESKDIEVNVGTDTARVVVPNKGK
ncbi:MAG: hypothetical protein JNM62_08540 [Flavobacteriales bacterium]|nr:hypothetical protein [Flavobacteriales bacterium]